MCLTNWRRTNQLGCVTHNRTFRVINLFTPENEKAGPLVRRAGVYSVLRYLLPPGFVVQSSNARRSLP
jgi:hypothetical protein